MGENLRGRRGARQGAELPVTLLQATIDHQPEHCQQGVGHAHEEVDALVVGAGLDVGVFILRTGGGTFGCGYRVLSGRAGGRRPRRAKNREQRKHAQPEHKPFHWVSTSAGYCTPSRGCRPILSEPAALLL